MYKHMNDKYKCDGTEKYKKASVYLILLDVEDLSFPSAFALPFSSILSPFYGILVFSFNYNQECNWSWLYLGHFRVH